MQHLSVRGLLGLLALSLASGCLVDELELACEEGCADTTDGRELVGVALQLVWPGTVDGPNLRIKVLGAWDAQDMDGKQPSALRSADLTAAPSVEWDVPDFLERGAEPGVFRCARAGSGDVAVTVPTSAAAFSATTAVACSAPPAR